MQNYWDKPRKFAAEYERIFKALTRNFKSDRKLNSLFKKLKIS